MKGNLSSIENYIDKLNKTLEQIDKGPIDDAITSIIDAYESESTVYIFGNGGSGSTASHIVCDFNKGISIHFDKKFNFVCLNDNVATMLAIANDCGYEDIFKMQLEGRLRNGDIVIAISGSGNSKNILKAVDYANSLGNTVISLTGYNGGKLMPCSDIAIRAPIDDMQKTEDIHMMILHMMAQIISDRLGHPLC